MGIAGRRNEVYAIGLDGCEGSEYLHALINNGLDTLEADCSDCEPITRIA